MTAALELRHVSRFYRLRGEVVAGTVDASLVVEPGEVIGIVGPSGSGKTTLLNLVIGWESPDGGLVVRSSSHATWSGLAVVPQAIGLLDELNVVENIELPARLGNHLHEPADSVLESLDMVGLGGRLIDELSMGEQQRVAVARALAYRPGLLVADEPTAHLDERRALTVARRLAALAGSGSAVLIATHDRRILGDCHRVLTMSDGHLTG
jgi:putative ABC transport system ATP-binding protein